MKSATYVPVRVLAVFAVIATSVAVVRAAGTTEIIYSFAGEDDGEYADTDLVIDSTGNLYGTTVLGGDFGGGTVWQLTPSDTGWAHTVLYSFTGGADGGEPYKGVTLDAQGNIYGTAVTGGSALSSPTKPRHSRPRKSTAPGGARGLQTRWKARRRFR